jgi:branched-chain amino acid transport system permease protein
MIDAIQILVSGLFVGSIFAMLALSFSLVYRVTGVVNLAQGAFCVIAALATHSLHADFGWSLALASLAAVAGTTLLGALIGATVLARALDRLSGSNILMLTAGIMTLLEGAAFVVWGGQPYALPAFSGEHPITVAGIRIAPQGLWIAGLISAVVAGLWVLLAKTSLGRTLRACAGNPAAARLMGINVRHMSVFSFGLAAAIAALSGVVVAPILSLQFDTATMFSVMAFIAMTIGGMGTFAGAIVGGLLLGVVGQGGVAYLSSMFGNVITMTLLMAVLIFRPNGLLASGRTRRADVRVDVHAHIGIVRIPERTGWKLAACAAFGLLVLPLLLSGAQAGLINTLVITGILFISVIGLDLLMGYAGQANLGQAGFMAIGGYASAYLSTSFGASPLLALGVAVLIALVCALVLALITMRLRGLYLALATLAFGLLVDSLAVGLSGITGGPSGAVGVPSFAVGSYSFDSQRSMYYLVLGLIAVLLLTLTGALRTRFGRALQAIRTDQIAAAAMGINVPFYKAAAFVICAALGALSGGLYAFNFHYLSPDMVGMSMSLALVAMLIVGGEGTLVGGLFGVALLTIAPTVFQPLANYKMLATGAILVLTYLYLPAGLYGSLAQAAMRRVGRRPAPATQEIAARGVLQ